MNARTVGPPSALSVLPILSTITISLRSLCEPSTSSHAARVLRALPKVAEGQAVWEHVLARRRHQCARELNGLVRWQREDILLDYGERDRPPAAALLLPRPSCVWPSESSSPVSREPSTGEACAAAAPFVRFGLYELS